jgi:hypothetical protein
MVNFQDMAPIVPLKSLFANNRRNNRAVEACVDIATTLSYERIVAAISECFQVKLLPSNEYDEFDAYFCELDDHDIVLLRERDLRDVQPHVFQLVIEAGCKSDAEGLPVDISVEVVGWLRESLSDLEGIFLDSPSSR